MSGLQKSFGRDLSLIVSIALMAVMILSGCEGGRPDKSRSGRSSNGIVFTIGNDISNMDPAQMNDIESAEVAQQVYEGLVRFKHGSVEVEPCLATSWTVSDDGLEWLFKLRPNVKFSDGSDFDSESVVFSIMRQMDEKHPSHVPGRMRYSDLLFGDPKSTESQLVKTVEAVSTDSVKITLARPYMPFLPNLAMTQAFMISPKAAMTLKADLNTTMVGTGPFVLSGYKRDQRITVSRNANYWGPPAKLDQVDFQVLRDPNIRLNSLLLGDCDVITGIDPYSVPLLEEAKGVAVLSEPSMNLGYLLLNCADKPLDNPKVRLAINFAIDRNFICNVLFNKTSVPAKGINPPGMLGYEQSAPDIECNPDKAKALLKEAGLEKGFTVTLSTHNRARIYNPVGVRLAERIQQDLAKVGITANIDQMEFPTFLERSKSRQISMGNSGWISDNGDPDNFIYELVGREDNSLHYKNPEATSLLRAAAGEKDHEKRKQMYLKAEKMIMSEPPIIPINYAKQTMAIRTRVKNFTMHPTGVNRLQDVSVGEPQ